MNALKTCLSSVFLLAPVLFIILIRLASLLEYFTMGNT